MFIYSSADGYLGCSHVLGIVNIAAIYIGVMVPFSNYDFLMIYAQESDCWMLWLYYFSISLYWSIINLKCCVSFRCITKWFSYTYTYSLIIRFFSHTDYYRLLGRVPCVIQ